MALDLRILTTHPVQYHVPVFRELAALGLDIEVGYYHLGSAGRSAYDTEFGIEIEWDIDLLTGYNHQVFLMHSARYTLLEQIRSAPQLLRWSLRDRNALLLLIGWPLHVFWLIWLIRIILRQPVAVLAETTPLSFEASAKPRWRIALLSWLLRHTTICFYIGSRNKDFFRSMGVPEERLFHTPYSIDLSYFSAKSAQLMTQRRELCSQYGINPDLPTFLFSGKLIAKKRPLELLQAYLAAELKNHVQLVFVGDGKLRPELEALASAAEAKNVHFLGFLNQQQMPLAYVLGEVLCLLSEPTETWGLVVNEALACKRPVIAANTVGCTADLIGPENGWIVRFDDHKMLANTLTLAIEKRAEWHMMGMKGFEHVQEHTFPNMAHSIKTAYIYSRR